MRHTLLSALFSLFSVALLAQANVQVSVTDAFSGEPILFGTVTMHQEGRLIHGCETNIDGIATFRGVKPGEYKIGAAYVGYENNTMIANVIAGDNSFQLSLSEGSTLEEVVVTAYKAPLMKTSSAMSVGSADISASRMYVADGTTRDRPTSGQVTAGEWNDLHNWKDWLDLLENEDYSIMTNRWEISPKERYSVLVLNDRDTPLVNANVQLLDSKKKVLWSAKTDNAGKAELWLNVYETQPEPTSIRVDHEGTSATISEITSIKDGSNTVTLKNTCSEIRSVDIAFTVDATGSMSDEISYLTSELLDVIERVQSADRSVDIRLGSVFYRDEGEDYVTKTSELTGDITHTLTFIEEQYAQGGGDYAEAVDSALHETLNLNWRSDAVKLCFLLLDAPPHEDEATLASIKSQIREAAERGVRLIPITASGIDRETEFLMKFMAVLTNGTYVFITDDSGIGNPHLDPVVSDYEVEKLNDLMVRIITQFTEIQTCDAINDPVTAMDISVYPNPATNYINVKTTETPDKITVTSNSGMVVKTVKPDNKESRIELDDLVNGMYTVTVYTGDTVESQPILVVR